MSEWWTEWSESTLTSPELGLTRRSRAKYRGPAAYDKAPIAEQLMAVVRIGSEEEQVRSWDELRCLLAPHAAKVEALAMHVGLEQLVRFVYALAGLPRAISDTDLHASLDERLNVPRRELLAHMIDTRVVWFDWAPADWVVRRCEWDIANGTFTREAVDVLRGSDPLFRQ